MATPPVLVACAHGTRDPAGRRAAAQLRLDVAALRPGLEVLAASVDVQQPTLRRALDRVVGSGRRAVVVPLLLSSGYHVHVDIAREVGSAGPAARAAAALGPDAALVDVLADRLADAGVAPDAPVVLGAAGSSDPRAVADVETVAGALADRRSGPVLPAYLSAASPTVREAVASLGGRDRVAVACYLLAPGFFARQLWRVADVVTAPLAPHPRLAELVLRRYDEALA